MELEKVKKYTDLINDFSKHCDEFLNVENKVRKEEEKEKISAKEKKEIIEIIEYFANILTKYFYNEYEIEEDISIVNSGFDSEQLWYFIECLIKENKLQNLNLFFNNYENRLEIEKKTHLMDTSFHQDVGSCIEKKSCKRSLTDRVKEKNMKNAISKKRRKINITKSNGTYRSKSDVDRIQNKDLDQTNEEDRFFNYDEMHQFLDQEDNKILHEQSGENVEKNAQDEGSSGTDDEVDLNQFEGDYEEAGAWKYGDFYGEDKLEEDELEEDELEEDELEEDELEEDKLEEDKLEEDELEEEELEEDELGEDELEEEELEEDELGEDELEEDELGEDELGEDELGEDELGEDELGEDELGEDELGEDELGEDELGERAGTMHKRKEYEIERELSEINQFDSMDNIGVESSEESSDAKELQIEVGKDKRQIEKELIAKKHWSLTGEVFGYNRPKNSLLKLNVDIPKVNLGHNDTYISKTVGEFSEKNSDELLGGGEVEDGADGADEVNKSKDTMSKRRKKGENNLLNEEIELVVKQRIQNMLFDDVEKKGIEDLEGFVNSNKDQDGNMNEVNFDHLNFTKSKLSLTDEYTKKYEEEIKNSQSKNKELNLQKLELMNLFKKIMHSCDSLCNDFFTPKPVLLNVHNKNDQIANLHIEETVPIILSDKNKKAPEELYRPGHIKQMDEMHEKEKKSLRKSKKIKRKKKLLNQFRKSGKGIIELQNRNQYLLSKNQKIKGEKTNLSKYGVSSKNKLLSKPGSKYNFAHHISKAQVLDMRD
ncbi:U3 small nucleolar ribonucleoprotein protein MPP10 [Plasmodium gonderi]|uniref:U3 small nucleolar ribonucleoprotein protein MPP10 n=1 Tax=Plasmodium gonderi TaxID=77519 RepID=A0A1Y1JBR4_PLAGO|nr:U3 small nucleolar ribonucleoprotein protein MPP10 [Plasmodium gonderi]GAW79971.1 U3 small nucleolar ribonucleoprotein protein MPP10 [Plasmodium gonderi]